MPRSIARPLLTSALVVAGVAGCSAGSGRSGPPTAPTSSTRRAPVSTSAPTAPSTAPSVIGTGPVDTAALTRADGACPLVPFATVVADSGMRLARQVVISQSGRAVGCDFYADQNWVTSERLPGPDQPAVRILIRRYATPTSASNAMVIASRVDPNAHEADLAGGVRGISYRITFDPADHGDDWAYAFTLGSDLVAVDTVQDTELPARQIAGDLATRL